MGDVSIRLKKKNLKVFVWFHWLGGGGEEDVVIFMGSGEWEI